MQRLPNRRMNTVIVSIICDCTDPPSKDEASPQATRQRHSHQGPPADMEVASAGAASVDIPDVRSLSQLPPPLAGVRASKRLSL